ncbi:MAG: hypothetical protein WBG50_06000 [Desulfomonilaceae bacterium]
MLKADSVVNIQLKLSREEIAALHALPGGLTEHVVKALEAYAEQPEGVSGLVSDIGFVRLVTTPVPRALYERFLGFWALSPYDRAVRDYLERKGSSDVASCAG